MSKSAHPHEGGSYIVDKDGKRTRVAFTAAEAAAPAAEPPAAPASEKRETTATDKDSKRKERNP